MRNRRFMHIVHLLLYLHLADTATSLSVSVILTYRNDIKAVYYDIHDSSHDEGSEHIKYRMLLQKHGRKNDGNT